MISKSLNGIYLNPIAKDKKLEVDQTFMQYICRDHRIYWEEGRDETVHFPVKTADHHPEYSVIGTES